MPKNAASQMRDDTRDYFAICRLDIILAFDVLDEIGFLHASPYFTTLDEHYRRLTDRSPFNDPVIDIWAFEFLEVTSIPRSAWIIGRISVDLFLKLRETLLKGRLL